MNKEPMYRIHAVLNSGREIHFNLIEKDYVIFSIVMTGERGIYHSVSQFSDKIVINTGEVAFSKTSEIYGDED
jgi:hypothetical protein